MCHWMAQGVIFFFRKRWYIPDADGSNRLLAKEDSLILALMEIDDSMIHHDIVDFEARMPVVSIAIGLACFAAFMAEIAMKALADIDELVRLDALESSPVFEGEYWRMLSCTLLHGGFDHILGNTSRAWRANTPSAGPSFSSST